MSGELPLEQPLVTRRPPVLAAGAPTIPGQRIVLWTSMASTTSTSATIFLSQSASYQVGVLIHEAAHHAGPNDVTYNRDRAKSESQQNQLMNAANYQYFAESVAQGGCSDKDGNCVHYTSYCGEARIKDLCPKTCGACGSGSGGGSQGCADTYAHCQWYRDNNQCGGANVQSQCRRTCGLCR